MIEINKDIVLSENELNYSFIRSGGPGGQNVNKVATAVQLRFNVKASPNLSDEVKERLKKIAGKRYIDGGYIIIDARKYRHQDKNRKDALSRLVNMILKAAEKPKVRKATKPGLRSEKIRLERKRQRSSQKDLRKPVLDYDK